MLLPYRYDMPVFGIFHDAHKFCNTVKNSIYIYDYYLISNEINRNSRLTLSKNIY
jgi:hypothetical protein